MSNNFYFKIYDFIAWQYIVFFLSFVLISISLIMVMIRDFNWGIDFTGGMLITIIVEENKNNIDRDLIDIQEKLKFLGLKGSVIQYFSDSREIMIKLSFIQDKNISGFNYGMDMFNFFDKNIKPGFVVKQINWVGPSINHNLIYTGFLAFFVALISILIYIIIRFEWRLAIGSVISLIHDAIIIIGFINFFSIEIDLIIIAALMSAIGYSINDKVVIFDRVRENFNSMFLVDSITVFNISLSQVLNRTIVTSITTAIVLLILLIFGGSILKGFSIILLVGVIIGTISSIYVSSILAVKFGIKRKHLIKNK